MRRILYPAVAMLLAGLVTSGAEADGRIEGAAIAVDGGAVTGNWAANAHVRAYLGIPFAAPPVGDLRWKPPQAVAPWQGVRAATSFGPQCLQPNGSPKSVYFEYAGGDLPMSEDCLTLNVWTPAGPAKDLPVMVWLYGGGFQVGAAARPVFNGTRLAERGVVVVTINYRVGILGFLAHPELSAESTQHASGNYGLLDQVAALHWVKRNIAAFGGNPGNVTIFGQSAGATSVVHLMASPLARGLFHRAVAESTALPARMNSLTDAEALGKAFAQKLGAASITELRGKSGREILDARTAAGPIVDGWFLPADTYTLFREGKEAPVPFLTGWNRNEGATFPHAASLAAHKKSVEDKFGKDADRALKLYPADRRHDGAAVEQERLPRCHLRLGHMDQRAAARQTWAADLSLLLRPPTAAGRPADLRGDRHARQARHVPQLGVSLHLRHARRAVARLDGGRPRARGSPAGLLDEFCPRRRSERQRPAAMAESRRRRRDHHAARRSHGAGRDPPPRDAALLRRMDATRTVTETVKPG